MLHVLLMYTAFELLISILPDTSIVFCGNYNSQEKVRISSRKQKINALGGLVGCCAEFESGEARAACPRSPSFLPFELRRRMAPRVVALPESQSF
jgi:hypothetical protein